MDKRPIDKSKKKNIYCAHCKHWTSLCWGEPWEYKKKCELTGEAKNYWCRCKQFEWKE